MPTPNIYIYIYIFYLFMYYSSIHPSNNIHTIYSIYIYIYILYVYLILLSIFFYTLFIYNRSTKIFNLVTFLKHNFILGYFITINSKSLTIEMAPDS